MTTLSRRIRDPRQWAVPTLVAGVLLAAFSLGSHASVRWVVFLLAGIAAAGLLRWPALGPPLLVAAALVVPLEITTGTEVKLNPATLLIPVLLLVWLWSAVLTRSARLAESRATLPIFLFLLSGLLSLLVGTATWDIAVPRPGNFLIVQLAQWGIFALSAGAFWLTANLVKDEGWLWRLTALFLLLAGGAAILLRLPGVGGLLARFTTIAFSRAPLWVLFAALVGGQLLFNRTLSLAWRLFLVATLGATLVYVFVEHRESASNWVGVAAVLGTLAWLRFRRLHWPLLALILALVVAGVLFPAVYNFAGGDSEWNVSGGSRLVLIQRVIEATMRNPITGLGPAAYRPYTGLIPLPYQHAYWLAPQINSHNNYVDLFAHVGVVGLVLFFWFAAEIALLGMRLRRRYAQGFVSGYVNGVLAAGAGALVIMMLADWILPFVYNIGFPGFQASVLVWLFMGGLVALDNMSMQKVAASEVGASEVGASG